jgi:hypothetical protein
MKPGFRLALLLPVAALVGCALPSTSSSDSPSSPVPTGNWTNWQIQAGTAITSPPNTYPSFLGAIQIQSTQASGIFTTIEATGTSTAEEYSGTYVASTGDVTLATYGFGFGYTEPATLYTLTPVGVVGGCVYPPGYTGAECLAIFASPSVGVQIAPLNGTYTGTLTDSATPGMSGAATLTLTQTSTPNSNGAFSLTGTIALPASLGTFPVSGTATGEGFSLNYCSTAVAGPCFSVTAATNPTATQITITNISYADQFGRSATYTGILTLQ